MNGSPIDDDRPVIPFHRLTPEPPPPVPPTPVDAAEEYLATHNPLAPP